MDKIQIIEKLFSYLLEYSYLLLPIIYLLSKQKKDNLIIVLAFYGLLFFLFLHFYYDIPKSFRKLQQAFYTFLEFTFFSYIYWNVIANKKVKNIILTSTVVFLIFHTFYFVTSSVQKIDSVPIGVETIFLLFFAFLYFQQYFKSSLSANIYDYPSFWLVVGIIIYLGSSFFFNILANHVLQAQIDKYWHFTYIPEIIKNILFALVVFGFFSKKISSESLKSKDIPNLDMI